MIAKLILIIVISSGGATTIEVKEITTKNMQACEEASRAVADISKDVTMSLYPTEKRIIKSFCVMGG